MRENDESLKKIDNKEDTIYFCKIGLADKKIELESCYKRVLFNCRGYLTSFERSDAVIRVSSKDILEELPHGFSRTPESDEKSDIATEYVGIESVAAYRKIADFLITDGILMMHGAAIAIQGRGFIFMAPSGTGKTTHVLNWLKVYPDTVVVNGDKPLVDVTYKKIYGSPWCGKEGMNTNMQIPLSGLISLERGTENAIQRIGFSEILGVLIRQSYIPQTSVQASLLAYRHIEKLRAVPCYRLTCNQSPESAITAYEGLFADKDSAL